MLPLLLPRLLPELSSALLCFTGEVSGDVRISSRDRGWDPQARVLCYVTRELCDNVSGCQSDIFTSGHRGEALSSWELQSPDGGGHGPSGQGGDSGDPQAEAGHNITESDNIARCHLTLFAVADL